MKIEVSHRPWFQIPSCLTYSFLALGGSWCSWHIHHPPSQSFVHSDPNVILSFSLGKFFPISKFGSSLPSTGSRLTKIKQTECFSSLFKSLWKYLCPTLFSVLFYFFQNDWFCISKFITTIKYKEEYNWHPFFFFFPLSVSLPLSTLSGPTLPSAVSSSGAGRIFTHLRVLYCAQHSYWHIGSIQQMSYE